ncbi:hypothetical protein DFH09DRAFT_1145001 [Mycena vulgaris]|nr:hypothetical protein DFH09DRAFT_1145001 [Mycena vulgaris]
MHFSVPFLLFCQCIGLASVVHGQTLQFVSPLQVGSVTVLGGETISISPLGVGADGMTTYVEVGAETFAAEVSGTSTRTLLSTPIPFKATFVEDASKFMIGTTDSGVFASCTFRADGNGACVEQFVAPGRTSTFTTTYSGPVLPWYTLNAAASAVTPSPTPSSALSVSAPPSPTSLSTSQTVQSSTTVPAPTNAASPQGKSALWMMGPIVLVVIPHVL